MDAITSHMSSLTITAMRWSSPWWFLCCAAALATLAILNVLPLRVSSSKEHEYGFTDVAKIGARQFALGSLAFLCLVFWPVMYFATVRDRKSVV